MAILINANTRYIIQGITGKQGSRACIEMLKDGSRVVAGVTPGKAGQKVEDVPVYNSVDQAKEQHNIDVSVIIVPAKFAKSAIIEAIQAKIPLINIITENIPLHDMAYCYAMAKQQNIQIIGPTSAGIYSVGQSKCGPIASGKSKIAFTPGEIGVISRSGGMACETALVITQAGLGQSTVVSIGSDVLMGTAYVELVQLFEHDTSTEGIVLFGEIGGTAEEDLATYLLERKAVNNPYPKPIVAFISGTFAEKYQLHNISLGHAGAIIEGTSGTRSHKVERLTKAGVRVAQWHHQVGTFIKEEVQRVKHGVQNTNF